MIKEKEVRSSSRHALGVIRYHVWPMLREQRVDAHTCQMLRIYCCIWGPPSPEVTWAILWHDAGESDAGDCQFGAKRRYPELKAVLDHVEKVQTSLLMFTDVVSDRHPGSVAPPTDEEAARVKACDLLEGWEFALEDRAMGNRLASPVVAAYYGGLLDWLPRLTEKDREVVDRYMTRPYARHLREINEGRE